MAHIALVSFSTIKLSLVKRETVCFQGSAHLQQKRQKTWTQILLLEEEPPLIKSENEPSKDQSWSATPGAPKRPHILCFGPRLPPPSPNSVHPPPKPKAKQGKWPQRKHFFPILWDNPSAGAHLPLILLRSVFLQKKFLDFKKCDVLKS